MKKFFLRLAFVGVIGLALSFGLYLFAIAQIIMLSQPVTVTVPASGTIDAAQVLWDGQIIPSRAAFVVHLFLTGQRADVQAGTYTFSGPTSIKTVITTITQPIDYQPEVQVTFLEGWTNSEMAEQIAEKELLSADTFLAATTVLPTEQYTFLDSKPTTADLQGFLFPDTYRFFKGATASAVIEKMLTNFDVKFTEQMRQDLAAQQRTIYDAVILASIVEKEARSSTDKKLVAGIFWKRLDNNKRLESDATINYITKKNTTTPSFADLDTESFYNTYRNNGLPPTPICNPGLDALMAVVYPTASDNWFFLNTPAGEIKYSATYEEHLQLKHQYYD